MSEADQLISEIKSKMERLMEIIDDDTVDDVKAQLNEILENSTQFKIKTSLQTSLNGYVQDLYDDSDEISQTYEVDFNIESFELEFEILDVQQTNMDLTVKILTSSRPFDFSLECQFYINQKDQYIKYIVAGTNGIEWFQLDTDEINGIQELEYKYRHNLIDLFDRYEDILNKMFSINNDFYAFMFLTFEIQKHLREYFNF